MVLGKQGLRLEAWKFSVYLVIPIVASVAFNNPERQKYWADYFHFLKYPANPNIGLKEEFEELRKKREQEKQQRQEYAEQMKRLHQAAKRSREAAAERDHKSIDEETTKKRGWLW
jgi:hypothetical protein